MMLNQELCFRAVESRDRRFEGRFVLAVRTTGVYCRPGCPAPLPKRRNCAFYACAAAAEAEGYRPCRRCRPETAPGTPAWAGSSATVARALRTIHRGELDQASVEELAGRLGLGERQLRRLFLEHLGASPAAIARTRRVHFARRLIDQTDLPMTEIAFSSGFGSVRSFNQALRDCFRQSPSELRATRHAGPRDEGATINLRLAVRRPFDWPRLLDFLAARAVPGVEEIDGQSYRRTVRLGQNGGWIEAIFLDADDAVELRVSSSLSRHLLEIAERATRLFDLEADPEAIAKHLSADPRLRDCVSRRPGLRVPGAWDEFETTLRIVLGQQVSVAGATTLHGRLVRRLGPEVAGGERASAGLTHYTPTARAVADADLSGLGLTSARAATIASLSRAVANGTLDLRPRAALESAVDTLASLPGIGSWTAQMIAMRVMGEPDACPSGDLWLKQAFAPTGERLSEARVEEMSRAWSPWRAYAVVHVLTELGESAGRNTQKGRTR
ncbi:MAG: AlkA N-terminal domain-containing protein [Candidatus Eisenbacteria bacterium]